ncbi:hypothetical protein LINPERHAP2_LOCUS33730 [Linum perenne]
MTDDDRCGFCGLAEETVGHALRDCTFAKDVWVKLGLFDMNGAEWNGNTVDWISHHIKAKQQLIFGVAFWQIWKARNERLFANQDLPSSSIAARTLH